MPYKDSERKRQWEREHRQERNARRRKQPVQEVTTPIALPTSHDPTANEELQSAQLMLMVVVGIVFSLVFIIRWALRQANPKRNAELSQGSAAAI
jgi:hypothetical protein